MKKHKPSRLEQGIITAWKSIPLKNLPPIQNEILESFRDAIIGDDAPKGHAAKVLGLVGTMQIASSEMSKRVVRYSGMLLQTYASELARTGFRKKNPGEYEMLLGLANSTPSLVKIFRQVNAQESAVAAEYIDVIAAKEYAISVLQDEQSSIISADRRARRLYAKAENTLDTSVVDSILLYLQACEGLKGHQKEYSRWQPFQSMIRSINTRIGDAYYRIAKEAEEQKNPGYLDSYRNALQYYKKGQKLADTKALVEYCLLKLGQAPQSDYSGAKPKGAPAASAPGEPSVAGMALPIPEFSAPAAPRKKLKQIPLV